MVSFSLAKIFKCALSLIFFFEEARDLTWSQKYDSCAIFHLKVATEMHHKFKCLPHLSASTLQGAHIGSEVKVTPRFVIISPSKLVPDCIVLFLV